MQQRDHNKDKLVRHGHRLRSWAIKARRTASRMTGETGHDDFSNLIYDN
jgi:hypothetical protein